MIERIAIAQVATFGDKPEVVDGLSQFNYFYGPNASGKTTLSRLIANPADPRFSGCDLKWRAATPLEVHDALSASGLDLPFVGKEHLPSL